MIAAARGIAPELRQRRFTLLDEAIVAWMLFADCEVEDTLVISHDAQAPEHKRKSYLAEDEPVFVQRQGQRCPDIIDFILGNHVEE